MESHKKLSIENNEAHQLIINIQQYIFRTKWTWIGYFGGTHEVCLATGSWPSSLPNHVKQQWDKIENYLDSYSKGLNINPEKSLQEIVNTGVTASRQKEKPRRHPTTDWYYLIFSEYAIKGELTVLKREFASGNKPKQKMI